MSDDPAFVSGAYWQQRYQTGGNSGSGSYGRLAVYKAHVINELTHRRKIRSVVEFGSGDGNQASLFHLHSYTGVDVSSLVVDSSRARFADRPNWAFLTVAEFDAVPRHFQMSMSLDVIYHLVEDQVFDAYMRRLFAAAEKYVLIYASDHNDRTSAEHVRHRAYSEWISQNQPGWLAEKTWTHPYPRTEKSNPKHTTLAFFRLFAKGSDT